MSPMSLQEGKTNQANNYLDTIRGLGSMSTVLLKLIEENIPDLPRTAVEILEALERPTEMDIEALEAKMMRCGNLNEAIVQVLNSGYFATRRQAKNLHDAILLIGVRSLRNVVLALMIKLLFPQKELIHNFDRASFLRHCLGTAIACEMLTEYQGEADRFRLFTYGFTHDIGVLVLDYCVPFTLSRVYTIAKVNGLSVLEAENRILAGLTHATIGEWLCRKWNLPPDIYQAVAYHHWPTGSQENRRELSLLHLGDVISLNYYEFLLNSGRTYAINPEIVAALGLTNNQLRSVEDKLPDKVEQAIQLLDMSALDQIAFRVD